MSNIFECQKTWYSHPYFSATSFQDTENFNTYNIFLSFRSFHFSLPVRNLNCPTLACKWIPTLTLYWPQLRRAPVKFGWFIKLYNINVKILYKQADMGFAAEAGFLGGGGGKGAFCPKKGCNAPSAGYGFPRKKILHKLNTYCRLL